MKERPRLRDYQKVGVRFMVKAGVTFEGRSINADDMGMGKTPQALVTAVELGATKILVVVPNSLRWNWRREIKKWLPKRNVYVCDGSNKQKIDQIQAFEEGFLIVNIDFIRAMWIDNPKGGKKLARQTEELKTLLKAKFHFIIFDECFIEGTPINTPEGIRSIESLRIGDTVYGYDHNLNCPIETEVIHCFSHETLSPILEWKGMGVTGNHPIWTEEFGYIPVDVAKTVDYTVLAIKEGIVEEESKAVRKQMYAMPERMVREVAEEILLPRTLARMEKKRSRFKKEKSGTNAKYALNAGMEGEKPGVSAIGKEPLSTTRNPTKSANSVKGQRLCHAKWRKRKTALCSATFIGGTPRMADRIRSKYGMPTSLSASLQNRRCRFYLKNRHRGRWSQPSSVGCKRKRQAKRRIIDGKRMENTSFYEQRGYGRSRHCDRKSYESRTVFNIETKAGNYFAGGYLVHNCHRYGNKESLQSHGARWLAHAIPTATLLTGSPMRGKVTNLWHLLHMADKKKWSSFWKWAGVHANAHEGPYGWEMADTATDPAKLARDIAPVFIQRRKEDHLDLPELSHHEVWVRLGGRQRRQYDEMRKEMIVELDSGKRLLAPVILAQMVRLKQIAISPMLLDPSLFPLVYDKFINDEDEENDDIESYMKHAKFQALRDVLLGTDEKIIVFSQWEKTLQIVADLCRRNEIGFVTYTGQVADKTVARDKSTGKRVLLDGQRVLQRDYNEHLWKTDDYYQVMLATTSAGGIGLNWTEAGVMVRLDKLWVPDDNDQARDRMHRFGQTKRTTLIDILAEDTIEEKIEKMLKRGHNINEQVSNLFRSRSFEELL